MTVNSIRSIALIIVVSFLTACASTTKLSVEEKQQTIKDYALPALPESEDAMVYVIRPDFIGFAVRFKVYLDGKKQDGEFIGYTRGEQYLNFAVTPGAHTVNSKAENWSSVSFDASPGEIIFLKQTPRIGLLFSGNNLTRLEDIDGKYFMAKKELKLGTYVSEEEKQE